MTAVNWQAAREGRNQGPGDDAGSGATAVGNQGGEGFNPGEETRQERCWMNPVTALRL